MNRSTLCTEEEVTHLVHTFYDSVRDDELIGPMFSAHVHDWPLHLAKMVDFWSSTLRGTARYRGMPMVVHNRLPGLEEVHFQRWLTLFQQTTANLSNNALRERADDIALRIAQSLWYGYQLNDQADRMPAALNPSAQLPHDDLTT